VGPKSSPDFGSRSGECASFLFAFATRENSQSDQSESIFAHNKKSKTKAFCTRVCVFGGHSMSEYGLLLIFGTKYIAIFAQKVKSCFGVVSC